MTLKLFGAVFVIVGCGGFGFLIAAAHRREVKSMQQLISALDYMECELKYRLTPLPELCRQSATICSGAVNTLLNTLATELDNQISPDVEKCMDSALQKNSEIPKLTRDGFILLGRTLGRFDVEGQLKGIDAVRLECRQTLDTYMQNQDVRLRSYQTLGLCAGAAMAILFI